MSPSITAAIIAASVAALTGIINIIISIYKNRQDGITKYRMNWINDVRNEFTNILGWSWYYQDENGNVKFNSVNELRKSVYKISLFLNVKDDYDKKILKKTFDYFNAVEKAYQGLKLGEYSNDNNMAIYAAIQSNDLLKKAEKSKKELHKMIRVYLKTEWTRVKYDSSITKIGYCKYWKPIIGFNANKAIEKFSKEYKEIG